MRRTVKGGTGSGDVNTRNNVNIEQGFINAGYEIASVDWLDRQDALFKEAKTQYDNWVKERMKERGVGNLS